uniref:Uncharacterized protein n=1 Tax=Arundo donax TaxID=35708 RepID=A0A0A8YZ68_ARUDO
MHNIFDNIVIPWCQTIKKTTVGSR